MFFFSFFIYHVSVYVFNLNCSPEGRTGEGGKGGGGGCFVYYVRAFIERNFETGGVARRYQS